MLVMTNQISIMNIVESEWTSYWLNFLKSFTSNNLDYGKLSKNYNMTMGIILDNPDKDWSGTSVSRNHITMTETLLHRKAGVNFVLYHVLIRKVLNNVELALMNKDVKGVCFAISKSPRLTIKDIRENPHFPWTWFSLAQNFSFQDIKDNLDLPWDWKYISWMKASIKDVEENPSFPWCWNSLSSNDGIDIGFVLRNIGKNWEWSDLVFNPSISMKDILDNFNLPWDLTSLTSKKGLTLAIINSIQQEWDWDTVSCNEDIPISVIFENFSSYPWNLRYISERKDLTIKHVIDNISWDWSWWYLSRYSFSIEDILNNPSGFWDWDEVSKREDVTMEIVLDNPDKHWNWRVLSGNGSIKIKDILDNPSKPWYRDIICGNSFIKSRKEFIRNQYRRNFMKVGGMHYELLEIVLHPDNSHRFEELGLIG